MIGLLIGSILSCSKNEDVDSTPPGIITNVSVVPTNGGGIISYTLPSDSDVSYVRAEYTNSQGEDVFRVASKYNTSLEVNGLNQTSPIKVILYVVWDNSLLCCGSKVYKSGLLLSHLIYLTYLL